ncbi:hypothetical protein Tco_1200424 [Tanacetum coccineum]
MSKQRSRHNISVVRLGQRCERDVRVVHIGLGQGLDYHLRRDIKGHLSIEQIISKVFLYPSWCGSMACGFRPPPAYCYSPEFTQARSGKITNDIVVKLQCGVVDTMRFWDVVNGLD